MKSKYDIEKRIAQYRADSTEFDDYRYDVLIDELEWVLE